MSKHPRDQHLGHHLTVRATLWKTYIVCEECGEEYETAWGMLYQRFRWRIDGMLCLLFIGLLLLFGWMPEPSESPNWGTAVAFGAIYAGCLVLLRIALNALQAFLLRRSDDLASHIF